MPLAFACFLELQPVECSPAIDQFFRPVADHGLVERLLLLSEYAARSDHQLSLGRIQAPLDFAGSGKRLDQVKLVSWECLVPVAVRAL